jgi:hypothetical protein
LLFIIVELLCANSGCRFEIEAYWVCGFSDYFERGEETRVKRERGDRDEFDGALCSVKRCSWSCVVGAVFGVREREV